MWTVTTLTSRRRVTGGVARRVHEPMACVQRYREQRPGLPLEHMPPGLAFLPHLRRAAPLDDEHDLLVEMLLDIKGARAGDLDDIGAP